MAAVRSTLPSPDWSFRLRPEAREIQSLVSIWLLWLDFIFVFLSNYLFILKLFNFFLSLCSVNEIEIQRKVETSFLILNEKKKYKEIISWKKWRNQIEIENVYFNAKLSTMCEAIINLRRI